MKKFIQFVALILIAVLILTACGNYQNVDTVWHFDYAVISLPNGATVEGAVESWKDFENSDQIQVKIDGITYLVHSSDIALMAE